MTVKELKKLLDDFLPDVEVKVIPKFKNDDKAIEQNEIDKAIEQLDWYFYEDDGIAAEPITKRAYELLKSVVICDMNISERS